MEVLRQINAVKIVNEITTEGSSPIRVICDDGNIYIAKTTSRRDPPIELINEVLGGYFCLCWGLKVPSFALINLPDKVINNYYEDGNTLSNYYRNGFNLTLLFGSQIIEPATELEIYFDLTSKNDLKKFKQSTDILKIGALDLWIGNMDRKPKNPNIIMSYSDEGIELHPIDHAAIFCYLDDYKKVRPPLLRIEPGNSILNSALAKKISNFVSAEEKISISNEIEVCIGTTIANLDFIFGQIPKEWGFSKKVKEHLIAFFKDPQYIQETLHTFLSFK